MPARTASRATIYGPLFADSVLDDLDAEADILTTALTTAVGIARHRAVTAHDRWHGDVSEIHAHLTAHPAF